MKKSILLFSLLWLPFWVTAQWSVRAFAGGGPALETAYESNYLFPD